jgi:hypothetical protein
LALQQGQTSWRTATMQPATPHMLTVVPQGHSALRAGPTARIATFSDV